MVLKFLIANLFAMSAFASANHHEYKCVGFGDVDGGGKSFILAFELGDTTAVVTNFQAMQRDCRYLCNFDNFQMQYEKTLDSHEDVLSNTRYYYHQHSRGFVLEGDTFLKYTVKGDNQGTLRSPENVNFVRQNLIISKTDDNREFTAYHEIGFNTHSRANSDALKHTLWMENIYRCELQDH